MIDMVESTQRLGVSFPKTLGHELASQRIAQKANNTLERIPGKYRVKYELAPKSELFGRVTGTVLYAGSGKDLSPLVVFPNASTYVYQDLFDQDIPAALHALEEDGIVTNVTDVENELTKGITQFKHNGKIKKLVEVHGDTRNANGNENDGLSPLNEGIIGLVTPAEATQNLQAIYFQGLPYPNTIRALEIQMLPHLQTRGVFVGPYPFADGSFAGGTPEQLGLVHENGTFVKTKHLTSQELEQTIGYSLDDYREGLIRGVVV